MQDSRATTAQSEREFASLVESLAADPTRREQLTDLLREDHPCYDQRGTAAIVRMRGWVLHALSQVGLSESTLIFVLEELDTGVDAYLVAAAARALRSYSNPAAFFAPYLIRALANIRYRDEPVSFESYGAYSESHGATSPVRELLATLEWMGPSAREFLSQIESLGAQDGGLPKRLRDDVDRAVKAIRRGDQTSEPNHHSCCASPAAVNSVVSWARDTRCSSESVEKIVFEDHEGASLTFKEFFYGHPSIVVFFYTRCDNPLKCSLTITKLAYVQKLLREQGLSELIHTAAITYDPAYDLPERLRAYGKHRGVRLHAGHRMLRSIDSFDALRSYFELGVNFIESLVNRHQVQAYVLDNDGRIAASFERLHWDEQTLVDRASALLRE